MYMIFQNPAIKYLLIMKVNHNLVGFVDKFLFSIVQRIYRSTLFKLFVDLFLHGRSKTPPPLNKINC